MKKLLCSMLIMLFCAPALALTNTEYRDMLNNPEFARADKRINDLWDKVQRLAPSSVKKFLNQAQSEWWDYQLDSDANDLIEDKKYSREKAYAKATELCADKLQVLLKGLSETVKPNKIIGKYVRIWGKDETAWLEVKWANKKKSEIKIELFAIGGGNRYYGTDLYAPNIGEWEGSGVLKNRVLAFSKSDDTEEAYMIFVFQDSNTVLIQTTSEFFRFVGAGVIFDGVYIREK